MKAFIEYAGFLDDAALRDAAAGSKRFRDRWNKIDEMVQVFFYTALLFTLSITLSIFFFSGVFPAPDSSLFALFCIPALLLAISTALIIPEFRFEVKKHKVYTAELAKRGVKQI